ncbi:FYVE and coiled-coil domain-containing protein 1-like isoform X2 [Anneissia japonica]|uniref:FYVE and coiled-coil domain-containing protein 1-like isoform X2 n=1 Tax=Anneissia japonica TaxID=1529436 RepID=UPI0014259AA6|nr:FYVE and coiled-coil domain-containing protein 1-like isoform X2 [Anneissia japonica]
MEQETIPKVVQDLQSCAKELKKEFDEYKYPVTDDSVTLHKFCSRLEYLMQGEFKIRYSLIGPKKEYWDYFVNCLNRTKGFNDGIKFVKGMSEVRTSLGRGRAFIRYSLVHQRLADTLQQCFTNRKVTSDWYSPKSFLSKPQLTSILINDLYDLNGVQFDLSPTGNDLDAVWPTFARKNFSHGLHLWQPPSRTTSMNSLSSQATNEILSTSVPEEEIKDEHYSQIYKDFQECEELNRQLRRQITSMETENEDLHKLALETEERLSRFQEEAERFKQDTLYKLEKSEIECQKKNEQIAKMDDEFQAKLKDSEQMKTDLCDRIECLNKQHESREKFLSKTELELQSRIAEQETIVGSLRLQVTSFTNEQESSNLVILKKDELIQDLESKLANFESKNMELLLKMEGMVDEKNVKASSHYDSASKVHELLSRLNDVETENLNLKGIKEELIRKIELLEGSLKDNQEQSSGKISELNAKVNELEESYKKQLEESHKYQAEKNTELSKVEELNQTLMKMELRKRELESELKDTKNSLSNNEHNISLLSKDFESLKQEKQKLVDEKFELESSKGDLAGKVIQTEIQVQELKEQLLNLKTIFSQIDCSNTEEEMLQKSEDDNRDATDNGRESSGIQERLHSIVMEKKTLKENLQASNDAILVEKSQRSHFEKLVQDRNFEVENLLDENKELKKNINALEFEISKSIDTIKEQKKKNCLQEEELTKLQTENIILKNDCENLFKKEAALSCHLQEKDKEVLEQKEAEQKTEVELQALAEMLSTIEAEKQELVQKSLNGEQSIAALREKVQSLMQEKEELERSLDAMEKSLEKESATTREIQTTLEEVIQVQEDRVGEQGKFEICKETLQKEHEDKLAFLREQFDMLQAQFISLSEEKEKMDVETVALLNEKATLERDLIELKEKSERESKQLFEKSEMLIKERTEIKDKNDALNIKVSDLTELLESAKTENEEALKKWSDSATNDNKTLEENTVEIKGLHDSLEFFSQENIEVKASLDDVRKQLEEKTAECASLVMELDSTKEQLSAMRFQASTDVMKYEDSLKECKEQEELITRLKEKAQEQEIHVVDLETNLETVRRQLEEGRLKQAEELSKLLEEEKSSKDKMRHDLEVLRDDKTDREVKLEAQITQIANDNKELKKRLVKLLREKDTLWQRTEKLDYLFKQKASERWLEDKDVKNCMQCDTEFGLTVRRHHCRLCGRIFCSKCSNNFVMSSSSNKKVRVCEPCYIKHEHSQVNDGPSSNSTSLLVQSDDEEEETFNPHDKHGGLETSMRYEDSRTSLDYSSLPLHQEQSPTESEIRGSSMTGDQDMFNYATMPKSPDTPTKASGDEFSIISEDEISVIRVVDEEPKERSRTVTEESLIIWDNRTIEQIQENSDEFNELDIDAGVGHGIPIMVEEPGVSIWWEFTSSPKSIGFAVLYRGTAEDCEVTELIPLCRCNAHREAIQGELTTKQAGLYTLVFDNSFSRFTAKLVKYRLQAKTTQATY